MSFSVSTKLLPIPAYQIKLSAGRNFYQELVLDNNAVIINETALRTFGFSTPESAINQEIGDVQPRKIVGVIKDFHQQSLKMANHPIVLYHIPWQSAYLTVTLQGKDIKKSMAILKENYQEIFPNNAFESFFLDDYFQQQYESEQRLSYIFSGFSLLAISIACLGLFGLAMFSTKNRTKEIGIRKVMGAGIGNIVLLLSKDFLRLVLLAIVLASPIAWYVMHKWLQEFAYKIDIAWWVFALTGLLAMGIALLTVSFESIKAALMNPIKSLRMD
jgi:putative ABC transport system permease protein